MYYADLHCHNHSMAFYTLLVDHATEPDFHPWTVISSNQRKQRKGVRAGSYTQCDFVKLHNGKVKLTFNSLYPIEKGFVVSPPVPGEEHKTLWEKFTWFLTHHNLPLRDFLQMVVMHLPDSTIDFLQSSDYHYWDLLQREYAFAIKKDGQSTRNSIYTPTFLRRLFENESNRRKRFPESLEATGTYTIPKNNAHLQQLLNQPDHIITAITIEGAHSLGSDHFGKEGLLQHVEHIKKSPTWPHPVFFITLAHHFDNTLCGHARSFPKMPLNIKVLDQSNAVNGPFTEAGKEVLRKFLSLNDQFERDLSEGYRILIDVKHMAPRSRTYFYEVVNICLQKGDVIPVIASHVAYSGVDSINELIALEDKAYDEDTVNQQAFNFWGINICGEDVEMVVKTGGLMGLSFDQRVLGCRDDVAERKNGIEILCYNINAIAKAAYNSDVLSAEQKKGVWDCICIGTDFEGYIDPVNTYPTALHFRSFEKELLQMLKSVKGTKNPAHLKDWSLQDADKNSLANLVRKLCFDNCINFVVKHYPDK